MCAELKLAGKGVPPSAAPKRLGATLEIKTAEPKPTVPRDRLAGIASEQAARARAKADEALLNYGTGTSEVLAQTDFDPGQVRQKAMEKLAQKTGTIWRDFMPKDRTDLQNSLRFVNDKLTALAKLGSSPDVDKARSTLITLQREIVVQDGGKIAQSYMDKYTGPAFEQSVEALKVFADARQKIIDELVQKWTNEIQMTTDPDKKAKAAGCIILGKPEAFTPELAGKFDDTSTMLLLKMLPSQMIDSLPAATRRALHGTLDAGWTTSAEKQQMNQLTLSLKRKSAEPKLGAATVTPSAPPERLRTPLEEEEANALRIEIAIVRFGAAAFLRDDLLQAAPHESRNAIARYAIAAIDHDRPQAEVAQKVAHLLRQTDAVAAAEKERKALPAAK